MAEPVSRAKRALLAVLVAVVTGLVGGELLLNVVFPELPVVASDCCAGWKPCPGRKPEKFHGRKAVWWCGSAAARGAR